MKKLQKINNKIHELSNEFDNFLYKLADVLL